MGNNTCKCIEDRHVANSDIQLDKQPNIISQAKNVKCGLGESYRRMQRPLLAPVLADEVEGIAVKF